MVAHKLHETTGIALSRRFMLCRHRIFNSITLFYYTPPLMPLARSFAVDDDV